MAVEIVECESRVFELTIEPAGRGDEREKSMTIRLLSGAEPDAAEWQRIREKMVRSMIGLGYHVKEAAVEDDE